MIFDMGKNLHKSDKVWEEISERVDGMHRGIIGEMNLALFPMGREKVVAELEVDMERLESTMNSLGKFSWEPGVTASEKAKAMEEIISVFGLKEVKDGV